MLEERLAAFNQRGTICRASLTVRVVPVGRLLAPRCGGAGSVGEAAGDAGPATDDARSYVAPQVPDAVRGRNLPVPAPQRGTAGWGAGGRGGFVK